MSRGRLVPTVVALGFVVVLVVVVKAAPAVSDLDNKDAQLEDTSWADGQGNYQFTYRSADGTYRSETGTVTAVLGTSKTIIVVEGRVEWVAPDGSKHMYEYTADQGGYRVRDIPQMSLKTDKKDKGPGTNGAHSTGCAIGRVGADCDLIAEIMQGDDGDRRQRQVHRRRRRRLKSNYAS